jgi:hypothetical protein
MAEERDLDFLLAGQEAVVVVSRVIPTMIGRQGLPCFWITLYFHFIIG